MYYLISNTNLVVPTTKTSWFLFSLLLKTVIGSCGNNFVLKYSHFLFKKPLSRSSCLIQFHYVGKF